MTIRKKLILSFLTIAVLPVLLIESWSIYQAKKSLELAQIAGLETIADLKVDKVETFFIERKSDIEMAQHQINIKINLPIITRHSSDRQHPDYISAKQSLDRELKPFSMINSGYVDVMLVNTDGNIVYVTNDKHEKKDLDHPLPDPDGRAFEEGRGGIYFSDIFVNDVEGIPYGMLVTAPITNSKGEFSGVIVFEVDMDSIYQFIQETTGLGRTGETLIGTQVGSTALFLSPLRHNPDTFFNRSVKLGSKHALPLQEAVQAREGSGLSRDYRNAEIIAAW